MEQWVPGKELINSHERRLAELASLGWNIKLNIPDVIKLSVEITDSAINKMIRGESGGM